MLEEYASNRLFGIVGEERAEHPPAEVAAAERELIARLGGTRRQVRRRDRIAGALGTILGVAVLGMGGYVLLSSLETWAEVLEPALLPPIGGAVVFVFSVGIAGLLFLSGGAALTGWEPRGRPGWLVRKLSWARASLYRSDPWPEDLVRTIGPERRAHSEAEAQEALRQLKDLHDKRLKSTRRSMRVSAGVGAWFGLVGTMTAVSFVSIWASGQVGDYVHWPALAASAPVWTAIAWYGTALIVMAGMWLGAPFLLVGCVGLILCREWGRMLAAGVLTVWMATVVLVGVAAAVAFPFAGSGKGEVLLPLAGVPFGMLIYGALIRSLRSGIVREVCRTRGGSKSTEAQA